MQMGYLPHGLNLEDATTALTPDGVMFRSEHNRLSNLYPVEVLYHDITYDCLERAWQHTKALAANDKRAAEAVMDATNPYDIMARGNKVRVGERWSRNSESVFYELLQIKFKNESCRRRLLSFGKKRFYEATLHPIFGCGHHLGLNLKVYSGQG